MQGLGREKKIERNRKGKRKRERGGELKGGCGNRAEKKGKREKKRE